jgi:hypothetical protein
MLLSDTEQETLKRENEDEVSGSTFSFTRPSDFQRLSLVIKRNLSKQSGKREPQSTAESHYPTKKSLLDETNQLIGVVDQ